MNRQFTEKKTQMANIYTQPISSEGNEDQNLREMEFSSVTSTI